MYGALSFKIMSPIDAVNISDCYEGQIVYDPIAQKCFIYTSSGFKEITSGYSSTPEHKSREALICKSCGAVLKEARCEYCGSYSWEAREFFRQ